LSLAFIISATVLSLALSTAVAVKHRSEIGEQLKRAVEYPQGQEQQRQPAAIWDALNLTTIRREALEAVLNVLTLAVYLTDRHGQIVHMNRAAERQIGTNNAIRVANNHLVVTDHTAQLALARALDEVTRAEANLPTSGFTIALPGKDNAGLIATISPLSCGERQSPFGAVARLAAIFVQEPIAMSAPFQGEAFAELYGLTRCEMRVLLTMAPGLSVKDAAKALGVGEPRVKSHLQHIYSKTATSNRTELMRLFLSSTPPIRAA
jgi:DNA-binding NarL/FixJ family response regulator